METSGIRDPLRKLLIQDICGALIGFVLLASLSNFLIETLKFPQWVVTAQIIANFLYALFGIFLFVKKMDLTRWLRILANMNFTYGIFCIGLSLFLFSSVGLWPAVVLVIEALIVLFLAEKEFKATKRLSVARTS